MAIRQGRYQNMHVSLMLCCAVLRRTDVTCAVLLSTARHPAVADEKAFIQQGKQHYVPSWFTKLLHQYVAPSCKTSLFIASRTCLNAGEALRTTWPTGRP